MGEITNRLLMARCGVKLKASKGGKVKKSSSQKKTQKVYLEGGGYMTVRNMTEAQRMGRVPIGTRDGKKMYMRGDGTAGPTPKSNKRISKHANGAVIQQNGPGDDYGLLDYIPVVGTIRAGTRLVKNPSWRNVGEFAFSLGTDLLGASALKYARAGIKAAKAAKNLRTTTTIQRGGQSMRGYNKAGAAQKAALDARSQKLREQAAGRAAGSLLGKPAKDVVKGWKQDPNAQYQ